MDHCHRFRDWARLPGELVEEIILKIDWPEDVIYFSCVCQAWLTIFRRIRSKWRPANPWLLLSENTQDNPECLRKTYNPGNNKCYNLKLPETFGKNCWGSDFGWIVTYGLDLEINLFNPLTKSRLDLPSTKTMMNEQLEDADCNSDCKYNPYWMREGHILKACVLRVGGEGNGGLLVAVIHAHRRVCRYFGDENYVESTYLSIARPGDTRWTLIETPKQMFIRDVLFWKDLLWFVTDSFSLWYVNLGKGEPPYYAEELMLEPEPHYQLINTSRYRYRPSNMSYLLKSLDNELLLVRRHCKTILTLKTTITRKRNGVIVCRVYDQQNSYRISNMASTRGFTIFKLNFSNKRWELVWDDEASSVLGESNMFLGKNTSLLFANPKVDTCEPNCIYFAGDHVVRSGHDMGICYYKKCIHRLYEPLYDGGHADTGFCNPFWFTPLLN